MFAATKMQMITFTYTKVYIHIYIYCKYTRYTYMHVHTHTYVNICASRYVKIKHSSQSVQTNKTFWTKVYYHFKTSYFSENCLLQLFLLPFSTIIREVHCSHFLPIHIHTQIHIQYFSQKHLNLHS